MDFSPRPCPAVRLRPVAAGPILTALWEEIMEGRGRLSPSVRELVWRLPARPGAQHAEPGHLRRYQPTGGWFDRFKPRASWARGFPTEAGPLLRAADGTRHRLRWKTRRRLDSQRDR